MARELAITIYLTLFNILFSFFKLFPMKNKVTFVVSFGDNSWFVYEELKKQKYTGDIVFLKSKGSKLGSTEDVKVYDFETYHVLDTFLSIYHLATSQYVFIDNYYGFLAAIKFRDGVTCTQLWHAAGAIKQFGLLDPSNQVRTEKAVIRFHKVYQQFHRIVVGSENLAKIYFEAFHATEKNILRTGIPRTDLFYDFERMEQSKNKLLQTYPQLRGKKVILYAPTYREADLTDFSLKLDVQALYETFSTDTVLLLRLHPAIGKTLILEEKYKDFVLDCSNYPSMNDLLFISDILITDYSSIPFEYALLEKPMIFYPYDLEEYEQERGFWEAYEDFVPGPVAFDTKEIIEIIHHHSFDHKKIKQFKEEWNEYSKGKSSENLLYALSIIEKNSSGVKHELTSEN